MAPPTAQPRVSQIQEVEISGERFVKLDGILLVASKSESGTWHRIDGASCTCPGFLYRGVCRHITAAAQLPPSDPTPSLHPVLVTVSRTENYGGGWCVWWGPSVHGGTHTSETDAQAHAQALREAPAWDYAEWCDAHGYGVPQQPTRPALHLVGG